jgi:EmrB/QacA subfamily drug resistance transporter
MTNIASTANRRRWIGLLVVCMAQLMIVLDTTIVNVALPSIQRDLHFDQSSLTWVVNAFLVTYGSLLLLAGRLGDMFGRRRVFLVGVAVFTVASALCGAATDQATLIVARFLQGAGAAMQASAILALIVTEFPEAHDRARAMSAYVFTAVAGGSLGLLLGGALTEALNWHWIFFVNVPIGAVTVVAARMLIARDAATVHGRVDWVGSTLVTVSLMTAIFGIVQAGSHGWGSTQALGLLAVAAVLMAAFIAVEARIENPIMPLRILRLRGLVVSSVVRGLLVTGMYATFFLGTLYLEHVLHYGALQAGAAFLPWTLTVAMFSIGVTARLVDRFGPRRVLLAGMTSVVAGLALLQSAGVHGHFAPTLLIAFFLLGLGIGNAFMPLLAIAMDEVPRADAGLGSGIVNASQQLSGALGLAVLGTIATTRTHALGTGPAALVGGYHLAFAVATGCAIVGLIVAAWLLPDAGQGQGQEQEAEVVVQLPEFELEAA